jgi:hypothetical protein
VVGVERVTHAQRVGEHAGTDAEHLAGARSVVPARRDEEYREANDVQQRDEAEHGVELSPLDGRERGAHSTESR